MVGSIHPYLMIPMLRHVKASFARDASAEPWAPTLDIDLGVGVPSLTEALFPRHLSLAPRCSRVRI